MVLALVVWLLWIFFVDQQVGELGAYWEARTIATVPLYRGPLTLLYRAASTFVYSADAGEKLSYLTAIAIPILQLFITILVPVRDEAHRIAMIASLLAVLFVTFLIANPNKIIVYVATFPGFFATGMIFIQQTLLEKKGTHDSSLLHLTRRLSGLAYILYCFCLILFFILGTPLEWYY